MTSSPFRWRWRGRWKLRGGVLRPFDRRETQTLKQAEVAGRSEGTVRRWVANFDLGQRWSSAVNVSAQGARTRIETLIALGREPASCLIA
jgi:hypothetical protein